MKKIGLIGGISWSSTIDYYRYINEETNKRSGSLNFAECIIYSVNFEHFRLCNAAHDWDAVYALLLNAAQNLEKAGAELILLGANTAHIVAERVSEAVQVPMIDIRAATISAIRKKKIRKLGLLGTVFTMQLDFYKNYLSAAGLELIIPDSKTEIDYIEQTLLFELGKGIILPATKQEYLAIIKRLIDRGAEGIILGCTEIPLLISQEDLAVPVLNTTFLHAEAAVEFALSV